MRFSILYAAAAIAGIVGVMAGGYTYGFISTAICPGTTRCLSWVFFGFGFILVESSFMSLAAYAANRGRGNLLLAWLPTVFLALPILLLLPTFAFVFALPLFLYQTWVCVRVQLATANRTKTMSRA